MSAASATNMKYAPDEQKNWNKVTPLGRREKHQTYEGSMQMCTWADGRCASWAVKEIVMASIMLLHLPTDRHQHCKGSSCKWIWIDPTQIVPFFTNRLQSSPGGSNILHNNVEVNWAVGERSHSKKGLCQGRVPHRILAFIMASIFSSSSDLSLWKEQAGGQETSSEASKLR